MMSEASSGGVRSSVSRTAAMIASTGTPTLSVSAGITSPGLTPLSGLAAGVNLNVLGNAYAEIGCHGRYC